MILGLGKGLSEGEGEALFVRMVEGTYILESTESELLRRLNSSPPICPQTVQMVYWSGCMTAVASL